MSFHQRNQSLTSPAAAAREEEREGEEDVAVPGSEPLQPDTKSSFPAVSWLKETMKSGGGGSCSALICSARGWISIPMESSVFLGQVQVNWGAGGGGLQLIVDKERNHEGSSKNA